MSEPFDTFTPEAKRVLSLAQTEAQRLNHNYIGTEHLLLGVVGQAESVAARVLAAMGVSLEKVRIAVNHIIGRGDPIVKCDPSLTPRSKQVIKLAVEEARRLSHRHVGVEHLLLGLVREGEGIAAGVLLSLGATMEAVRAQVVAELSGARSEPARRPAQSAQLAQPAQSTQPAQPTSTRTRPLTGDELRQLLAEPLVASVGCVDESGAPYVVPSWFEYDGESFWLVPRAKSAWARYLQRDGRVCLSIDQRSGGGARVQVLGRAEIVEEPNVGGAWVPIATRMATRYMGPERGPGYLIPTLNRPRWLIRVRPDRVTSWAGGGWHPRYTDG